MASGLTPLYSLVYPVSSDPVNVASDVQDLAESVETALIEKASLESPEFIGIPVAPTATSGTNTTQIATTAFVNSEISNDAILKTGGTLTGGLSGTTASFSGLITSTVANGTTPMSILSTTIVNNLNADLLDGYNSSDFALLSGANFTGAVSGLAPTSSLNFATKQYVDTTDINYQTSSYQIVLSDIGKTVEVDSGISVDIVIPTNATSAFPVGSVINIVQIGSAQITLVPYDGTVTIQSAGGKLKSSQQYSAISLYKRSTNTWLAMGSLSL
jgi:hypothetical protein